MKEYFLKFIRDDEGAELIQFAIVVGIAALLAVAVGLVFSAAESQLMNAADEVNNIDQHFNSQAGGGGDPGN